MRDALSSLLQKMPPERERKKELNQWGGKVETVFLNMKAAEDVHDAEISLLGCDSIMGSHLATFFLK